MIIMRNAKCVVRNDGRGAQFIKRPNTPYYIFIIPCGAFKFCCAATFITHYALRITHSNRHRFSADPWQSFPPKGQYPSSSAEEGFQMDTASFFYAAHLHRFFPIGLVMQDIQCLFCFCRRKDDTHFSFVPHGERVQAQNATEPFHFFADRQFFFFQYHWPRWPIRRG